MSKAKCINKAEGMKVILEDLVREANEETEFSQRKTQLRAEHFVQTVVLGWLKKGDASLNELAQTASKMGYQVTGSAIHERIGVEAVELLGRVLVNGLRQSYPSRRLPVKAFEQFTGIYVTDSTQIGLPDALMVEFKGTNKDAMVKAQVTLDYLTGQWVGLELVDGKSHDQHSELPLRHAIAGSLNLFDLGYFKQERLRDIAEQDAYFVSRYQSQTALYEPDTEERIDLVKWLQSLAFNEAQREVKLGGRLRLPVRLLVRRLPQQVAEARRRKAKKRYTREGKTCSKSFLFLLGWDILITNLPADDWTGTQVFDLYPIRTQIEWVFRVWKSQLKVDHFGNWRIERVLTQLYAHLIGILLCHRLTAGCLWYKEGESSFLKCTQIIQDQIGDLLPCLRRNWWGLKAWYARLEDSFKQYGRKTKRKKEPSTCQTFMDWGLS